MAETVTAPFTRADVLAFQINLVVGATTGLTSFQRVAEKGIEQNRWFQVVTVHALDAHGRMQAQITMRIDWDQHMLHLRSSAGLIEPDERIEQGKPISVAIEEMISFFNRKAKANGWIANWVVHYAPGVDKALIEKELGLVDSPDREWASGETVHVYGQNPGRLDELSIDLVVVVPEASSGQRIAKATGIVKHFYTDKGYGFIIPDSGGPDVFVHFSAIIGSGFRALASGQRVEFEVTNGPKGPRAVNVTVAASQFQVRW